MISTARAGTRRRGSSAGRLLAAVLGPALLVPVLLVGCSTVPDAVPLPGPGGGPASPVDVPTNAPAQPTPTDDLAPFCGDEGWDTLFDWGDRRDELTACSTVEL